MGLGSWVNPAGIELYRARRAATAVAAAPVVFTSRLVYCGIAWASHVANIEYQGAEEMLATASMAHTMCVFLMDPLSGIRVKFAAYGSMGGLTDLGSGWFGGRVRGMLC